MKNIKFGLYLENMGVAKPTNMVQPYGQHLDDKAIKMSNQLVEMYVNMDQNLSFDEQKKLITNILDEGDKEAVRICKT